MKDGSAADRQRQSPTMFRREPAIVVVLFFLAPFVILAAPLATVLILILVSLVVLALTLLHGHSVKDLFRFDLGLALFALVAAYLFASATWSLTPSSALGKAAWFTAVVIMTYVVTRSLHLWNPSQIRVAGLAFVAGVFAGIAFILLQMLTDQAPQRLLYNMFPEARPGRLKGLEVEDGRIVAISIFELNRNVAVLLAVFWPALLCLTRLPDLNRRKLIIAALCLGMAIVAAFSTHETSQIGLVVSLIVFLLAWYWPAVTRHGVLAAWVLVFALIVPLSTLALKAKLQESEWLPFSAQHRIVLWAYRAEKVEEAPLLGVGLGSTRKLKWKDVPPAPVKMQAEHPWLIGWHAHNGFLEIWFELGLVGVILFLAAGWAVIGYIGRLSLSVQPFILAQFAALFVILAVGWGIWQSWLLALPGLAAIYAVLAIRTAEETKADRERA